MGLKTYRSDDVRLLVDGERVEGLASGSHIKITKDTKKRGLAKGSGRNVLVVATDNSGKIEITTQWGSPSHRKLSELEREGTVFSFQLEDLNELTVSTAPECVIEDTPELEYTDSNTPETPNRVWTILVNDFGDFEIGDAGGA